MCYGLPAILNFLLPCRPEIRIFHPKSINMRLQKSVFLFLLALSLGWMSCNSDSGEADGDTAGDSAATTDHAAGAANAHMNQTDFETLKSHFDDPARDEWQKPDEVVALLGDLKGKTVMDIGCGTGYFSFRLADAGAHVIAADVDDRFLKEVKEHNSQRSDPGQVEIRKLPANSPELANDEADAVLIVDTYHHLENRPAYFTKVIRGLKPGGKLYVVDFKKQETPEGPPVEMRISAKDVGHELGEAGFRKFELNEGLLPYQYVVIATR
jgi:ubiquinone/menaquinone biosynthesis C-methylase UbiE